MAEMNVTNNTRHMTVRHRGRLGQVWIYLGKQLRMFIYQNDWKVLPMAALIAGLVGMVIRNRLFDSMEGTLMGCFAMVCVAIWNGCFNSIQVICRERDVIKRQHRSGMHISSYIFSHMLYQLLLCALQTAITMYVTQLVGVKYYLGKPLFTPMFIVDYGITMLLITYASDMMSLWISCLAHSTTTAMTIMPFVLIFQLVFSGGMLTLPAWTEPLTHFTISNPGTKVLTAQADYNSLKVKTIWTQVAKMRDREIGGDFTVGQALDLLGDKDNPTIAELRAHDVGGSITLGMVKDWVEQTGSYQSLREQPVLNDMTLRDVLTALSTEDAFQPLRDTETDLTGVTVGTLIDYMLTGEQFTSMLDQPIARDVTLGEVFDSLNVDEMLEKDRDKTLGPVTIGDMADLASENEDVIAMRDKVINVTTTLGKVFDLVGEEKLKDRVETMAGEAGYKEEYAYTRDNIIDYWTSLILFILAFAALSTITLEFIDKDKR